MMVGPCSIQWYCVLTLDVAPPGYTSPNPNQCYAANSPYHSYAHHHQLHYPPTPEPQELPIEPLSPVNFSRKPVGGHQRNLSELSGDTALRSELETPVGTPHGKSHINSSFSSPHPGTSPEWQSPASARSRTSGQTWVPHESWEVQTRPEHPNGPAHGLGLQTPGGSDVYMPDRGSGADMRRYRRT
jgi:hypothetical protein